MERTDDLQYRGLMLIQDTELFAFGTDAVLLANFADVGPRDSVLDMGCGTGIITVLLSAKSPARLCGREIQHEAAVLARRNVELNGIDAEIIEGDLKEARAIVPGGLTAVVCNPPYDSLGSGGRQNNEAVMIARHEVCCTLRDVCESAASLLQTGGRFYMIHRAKRAAEAITLLANNRLEPKRIRFIAGRNGDAPGYVLIKCIKDAACGAEVMSTLVLYDEDGAESAELKRIYHRSEV